MSPELYLVLPIGFIWVPIMGWLLCRLGIGRTSTTWLAGWLALWAAGVLVALAHEAPLLFVGANALLVLFSGLMALGAWALPEPPLRLRLPLGLACLVASSVAFHLLDPPTGRAAASAIAASLLAVAAWQVGRHAFGRADAGLAERALCPGFAAMAVVTVATAGTLLAPGSAKQAVLGLWIATSVAVILLQLMVLAERSRLQARRLQEERDVLHRVALAGADLRDPCGAFIEAISGIQYMDLFRAFGVWALDADGARLQHVAGHLPGGVELPEVLQRPQVERPILRAALRCETPLFLDRITSDDRITNEVRSRGFENGFIAPLRLGTELVGVMGALLEPGQPLDEHGRRFVSDLADEAAVVLAAVRLRESEARQRAALDAERRTLARMTESVPVGIALSDAAGAVQLLNPRICEIFGIDEPERWLGRPARELILEIAGSLEAERRRSVEAAVAAGTLELRPAMPELEFRLRDGRVAMVGSEPVLSAEGDAMGRVWIARDVTRERRVAERIQHAQRMETVGTLAGGLAHDFNNQLTAILSISDDLDARGGDDEKMRESLDDLVHATEHCAELTRGLLTFARREHAEPKPVELEPTLRRLEALVRPLMPLEVELHVRVADDAGWILADELQLQRALLNLLVNARDAVGDGGHIELDVTRRAPPDGPSRIGISVRDDGIGMDEDTRRRIFDPFFTTHANGGGTGLGLAIAYGIVEGHGGHIEVESAPGEGATFRIDWPAAAPVARRQTAPRSPTRERAQGTVLLADDEPVVRRLIADALEADGFRVLAVADGDAALAAFARHAPEIDAALLDLVMPGRDGREVLAEILRRAPELPVAVISGHPSQSAPGWPEDVPVLMKPFRARQVCDLVREMIAGDEPHDA